MRSESLVIAGLPGSGKTTFLAALWHVVSEGEITTTLRLGKLVEGDASHLNEIARRWRNARVQERTPVNRRISMRLVDRRDQPLEVSFPDVSGEAFVRMWEDRDCDPDLVGMLRATSVALFVHADTIVAPRWVVDDTALATELELPSQPAVAVPWSPRRSPTQVQLVEIAVAHDSPAGCGATAHIADVVSLGQSRAGASHAGSVLAMRLPLLDQYLSQNSASWNCRVYGISAQGGDYDPSDEGAEHRTPEAERLRAMDCASDRIRVVRGAETSHDITEPLAWLMS